MSGFGRVRRRRGAWRRGGPGGRRRHAATSFEHDSVDEPPIRRRPAHALPPPLSIASLRLPASASPASIYTKI